MRNDPTDSPVSAGRALQEAWINWLGQWRWEWYCTLTFRDEVHPEAAEKRFRTFVKHINRSLYGPRWYKHGQGIRWVRALEYQRRGVIHFHALLAGADDLPPRRWTATWHELAGFAKIEPIESPAAVLHYVSKYVIRGGELDLGGPRLGAQRLLNL
jgi:hypothetical protein